MAVLPVVCSLVRLIAVAMLVLLWFDEKSVSHTRCNPCASLLDLRIQLKGKRLSNSSAARRMSKCQLAAVTLDSSAQKAESAPESHRCIRFWHHRKNEEGLDFGAE